jgi:anti-anti-sigma factor
MLTQIYPVCCAAERLGQFLLVRFTSRRVRLSKYHFDILEVQIEELVQESPAAEVVLDLSSVACLSSIDLANFAELQRQLTDRGLQLTLIGLSDYLFELFQVTGLDTDFHIRLAEEKYPQDQPLLVWED